MNPGPEYASVIVKYKPPISIVKQEISGKLLRVEIAYRHPFKEMYISAERDCAQINDELEEETDKLLRELATKQEEGYLEKFKSGPSKTWEFGEHRM